MDTKQGYFVISLDFELFWGMADKHTLDTYGENVHGVRTALPRILERFTAHRIHATWGTVGMLMAHDYDELLSLLPPKDLRPHYVDPRMSTYHHITSTRIGKNESDDPYHYGPSLVEMILETPHQEFANHTFSHYYAIDGSENAPLVLARDLDAHAAISKTYGVTTSSIIFPRNQVTEAALRVCAEKGMTAYRGNEEHFLYRPRADHEQSLFVRGLRLLDHYVNLSGNHTYKIQKPESGIQNVPASRFFRPYVRALALFEPLRIRRIKRAMTRAAKRGEVFHLWWHPHNFGINQEENFKNLESILNHFTMLQSGYGMQSASMREIATIASERAA